MPAAPAGADQADIQALTGALACAAAGRASAAEADFKNRRRERVMRMPSLVMIEIVVKRAVDRSKRRMLLTPSSGGSSVFYPLT